MSCLVLLPGGQFNIHSSPGWVWRWQLSSFTLYRTSFCEKTAEDSSSHFLLPICCSKFSDGMFLLGWTDAGLDTKSQPRSLFMAIYLRLDIKLMLKLIVWFFLWKRTPLFFTKLALKPAGAIDILKFSSFSNAMQTCKYQMVSWKSLVKFERSLKLWFGFRDEGVNNDAGRNSRGGQGPLGDDIKTIS